MKHTIDKITGYAISMAEPEEILIFGSIINGTANVYSDLDMLIITECGINKKEVIERIRNRAYQLSLKADVLIYSKLEFEREMNKPNSFVKAIYKSGKIVYKKY